MKIYMSLEVILIALWLLTIFVEIENVSIPSFSQNSKQPKALYDVACGEHPWMEKRTLKLIQTPAFELNAVGYREMIPYLVQVSYEDGFLSSRCAGAIISATEVLTASVCVPNDSQASNYIVRINNTWGSGQNIPVKRIVQHHNIVNDSRIAVIELEKSLSFSINGEQKVHVNRVCLRPEPACGCHFHLAEEYKPRLVVPTWTHNNNFSINPYIVSIIPNCNEGLHWHLEPGAPKIMKGSPLIETNLYNSYLKGIYIGTSSDDSRPTFRQVNTINNTSSIKMNHVRLC